MFEYGYKIVGAGNTPIPQRRLAQTFASVIEQNKLHERGERSTNWCLDIVEKSFNQFAIVLFAMVELPDLCLNSPKFFRVECARSVPKKSYNAAYQAMCRL